MEFAVELIVYRLDLDDFSTLLYMLHARQVVGLDRSLIRPLTEANVESRIQMLRDHGWMKPADRPGSHHLDDRLLATVAVVAAPSLALCVKSAFRVSSTLFYVERTNVVQIIVEVDRIILARLDDLQHLAAQICRGLGGNPEAKIAIAKIDGDRLGLARTASVDRRGILHVPTGFVDWDRRPCEPESLAAFIYAVADGLDEGRSTTQAPRSS
jgi:hypothetical protein